MISKLSTGSTRIETPVDFKCSLGIMRKCYSKNSGDVVRIPNRPIFQLII